MVWISAEVAAPGPVVWDLLTDPDRWPEWGPSVRSAELRADGVRAGVEGSVHTALGVSLPFIITDFEAGRRWAWRVAGVTATDHLVEEIDDGHCRVSFGVPIVVAPYLAICRRALVRLDRLAASVLAAS